jgi:hypothetical protein
MKQSVVDRYVDDIAYTLGVKREALNIVRLLPMLHFHNCSRPSLGSCCKGSHFWSVYDYER